MNKKYNITYWPYANAKKDTADCLKSAFYDSLPNLSATFALLNASLTAIVFVA